MTNRLTAEDLVAIRQYEIDPQSLAGNVILRLLHEIDALITERDEASRQRWAALERLGEITLQLGNTAFERNEYRAERDAVLARLEEYRRPEHWPEGSQMRHVRDLEMALAVSHRREAEADKELARLQPVVTAARAACVLLEALGAMSYDNPALVPPIRALRAALDAAGRDKEASE